MAISDPHPKSSDVVILQRNDNNTSYGEVHISGSNRIFYIDSDGHLNADDSGSFYNNFPVFGPVGIPVNSSSIVSWLSIDVLGTKYFLPLYQ